MRKQKLVYHFTNEGKTEGWYLDYLQNLVNATEEAFFSVDIQHKVMRPIKFAKTQSFMQNISTYHIADYEGSERQFQANFNRLIDEMSEVSRYRKGINYEFAYNNLTFELWMILHKCDCYAPKTDRNDYLEDINLAFAERFENLRDFKREGHFKRCLDKISLEDVKAAIRRAEQIMQRAANFETVKYRGFEYYNNNPSLMIWKPVKDILLKCGLL